MGIYSEPSEIKSYNFYNYDYFNSLSEIEQLVLKHNEHYSGDNVNLHELREAYFKSCFTNNLKTEWFIPNDSPVHSFKLPYHVSDHPEAWLDRDIEILNILEKKGLLHIITEKNSNLPKTIVEKKPLNYYINSHGFRSPELIKPDINSQEDNCIAFLGCSHTFGTGIDQKDMWTEIVANDLGCKPVNLGFPARGIDFVSFYCKYFFKAEIKNCKALVVLLPPFTRKTLIGTFIKYFENVNKYEVYKDFLQMEWIKELTEEHLVESNNKFSEHHMLLDNWSNRTDIEPRKKSIKKHFEQEIVTVENTLKRGHEALSVINLLASDLDIPLLVYSSYTDFGDAGFKTGNYGEKIFDMARDGQHAGVYTNSIFAKKVIKDLKQKIDK
tara:strand:- start:163 stop:1311 length:1149 start_codon:yes stop_codon:yes gene_type:complete